MTEVTFLGSVQGHQVERLRQFADRLRKQRPDLVVTLVEGTSAVGPLEKHKLKFGPGVLIDGRLEYVGIPRWSFLQERLAQVTQAIANTRTAAPPEKPAAKPAPAKPAAPPATATGPPA
jgi:hypothetical protein